MPPYTRNEQEQSQSETRAYLDLGGRTYEVLRDAEVPHLSYRPMLLSPDTCNHNKHVIKDGELFLVTNVDGNIPAGCNCGLGLYYKDTRFLSSWVMKICKTAPVLLSLSAEKTFLSQIELTNRQLDLPNGDVVPQETLYFQSLRTISDRVLEKLLISNYNAFPVNLELTFYFEADFHDIFDVRGVLHHHQGKYLQPKLREQELVLVYLGEDGVFRKTSVEFYSHRPKIIGWRTAQIFVTIPPKGQHTIDYAIHPSIVEYQGGQRGPSLWQVPAVPAEDVHDFGKTFHRLKTQQASWYDACAAFSSSDRLFDVWIDRSMKDLHALTDRTTEGLLISAGIPWYAVPFGRDSLITALQSLVVDPQLAAGTLRFLARHQGRARNDWRDEEPGKILHEVRQGQLANLGRIPHTPYYGTVDATPLFLITLAEYVRWTEDGAFLDELWPHVVAATDWLDAYGDIDRDGYVEYLCRSDRGLAVQGWKDSHNSVVHADGALARGPIALCEVQGYVYRAKRLVADLFERRGDPGRAMALRQQADDLKSRFNRDFWMEEEGCYALALDGEKRAVRTVTSNPGHCLWAGIVPAERAARLVARLLAPDMFSGWGIRTMGNQMVAYNPMSYHNGTVWPHDNSLIAKGMADYGFKREAGRLLTAFFDAAAYFPYYRLPELFCGFARGGELDVPVRYAVACSPQAWASACVFLFLQGLLGLEAVDGARTLRIAEPWLPDWLPWLEISRLRVGRSRLGLRFCKRNGMTGFEITAKEGDVKVTIEM